MIGLGPWARCSWGFRTPGRRHQRPRRGCLRRFLSWEGS